MKKVICLFVVMLSLVFTASVFVQCNAVLDSQSETSINDERAMFGTLNKTALEPIEEEGILFIREEEKLARDVYLVLKDKWGLTIFENISNSEQQHMDAVKTLIIKYELDDPVVDDGIGEFTNPTILELYEFLVETGEQSRIDGLIVGATIEEMDLVDIMDYLGEVEDNRDIIQTYNNLMKGSRNHLREFVIELENLGVSFTPQYLDQGTFDDIIGSEKEQGRADM